MNFICFL